MSIKINMKKGSGIVDALSIALLMIISFIIFNLGGWYSGAYVWLISIYDFSFYGAISLNYIAYVFIPYALIISTFIVMYARASSRSAIKKYVKIK